MRVCHSSFLNVDIDLEELSHLIAGVLGVAYRLTPLDVKCTYPVFRGEAVGEIPVFVKVGTADEWSRTVAILRDLGDEPFFARLLTDTFISYKSYAVWVAPWIDARTVPLDEMNDTQARSLVDGCVRLSRALQRVTTLARLVGSPRDPERAWQVLCDYSSRHPLAARPLRALLALSEASRSFAGRRLAVVHGDFHSKNYAFTGDYLSAVFDFDKLTEDLPCGDFVQTLVSRFSELSLKREVRVRLARIAREMLSAAPWSKEDLKIMANVWRLRFAAHRIAKHPNALWVGFDAARRDRRLVELVNLIEEVKK